MDHFIDSKIPKLGIFVDKNSQNDQTPFPKVGRKTPGSICSPNIILIKYSQRTNKKKRKIF